MQMKYLFSSPFIRCATNFLFKLEMVFGAHKPVMRLKREVKTRNGRLARKGMGGGCVRSGHAIGGGWLLPHSI